MYNVPQARNYVPSTLDIMYFYHKFDKNSEITIIMFLKKPYVFSITQPERQTIEPLLCLPFQ